MAPRTSTVHALVFDSTNGVSPLAAARYRLLSTLQTTLDVEEVLTMFRQELQTLVAVSGMSYTHHSHDIELDWGRQHSHSCHYRLITQRDNLGEITFYRDARFDADDLETVETLLSVLLPPLRNALLYFQAVAASLTDPLTGTGNRLAMSSHIKREISLARRYLQPLSVLVIDIDKFKSINDTYGHAVGDTVLQELSAIIRRINRSTDLCFRYGGEEFVILLSNTNPAGAMTIAERLLKAVSDSQISIETAAVQFTISIGVSTIAETDNEHTLIQRADKAMYQSKKDGGNKVCFL
jgi:diguanylate cyclase (GGDEF)-like protein